MPLKATEVLRRLQRAGFEVLRQRGPMWCSATPMSKPERSAGASNGSPCTTPSEPKTAAKTVRCSVNRGFLSTPKRDSKKAADGLAGMDSDHVLARVWRDGKAENL